LFRKQVLTSSKPRSKEIANPFGFKIYFVVWVLLRTKLPNCDPPAGGEAIIPVEVKPQPGLPGLNLGIDG